jgi:Domain of unknown function (DUF1905)
MAAAAATGQPTYGSGVAVEFSGEIWYWRGPAPYHFVTVPEQQSAELNAVAADVSYGWGMIPVQARTGGTEWKTSLFPKDGGYVVPVKDAVRHAERIDVGDVVDLHLDVRPRS